MTTPCEVTATALNLRAAGSVDAAVLAVLHRGQVGVATAGSVDGWLPVTFGQVSGFVATAWVRLAAESAPVATAPAAPAAPPAPSAPAIDVDVKLRDPAQLHPSFRAALDRLLAQLAAETLPFRVFEAFRTPERQEWLYAQGRTRAGSIVTNARGWASFHQYGMAADLVLFIDGRWSWSSDGPLAAHWARLRELAREVGLRTLSWEEPHVEWPVTIAEATEAPMLASGDPGWRDNLEASVARWRRAGGPGGPADIAAERPPLPPTA